MPISPEILKRLIYAKFLFDSGMREADLPMPFGAFALLRLHDAVEFFLQASADQFGQDAVLKGKRPDSVRFPEYWDLLNDVMAEEKLGFKEQMKRLSSARGELKHQGHLPSNETLNECKTNVQRFFDTNTPRVFKLEFAEISLVDVVSDSEIAELLRESEGLARDGEFESACVEVSKAFSVLAAHARTKLGILLNFPSHSFRPFGSPSSPLEDEINRVIRKFEAEFNSIRRSMSILALGIDFRKYIEFLRRSPAVFQTLSGDWQAQLSPSRNYTKEDHQWCLEFVIECAIGVEQLEPGGIEP